MTTVKPAVFGPGSSVRRSEPARTRESRAIQTVRGSGVLPVVLLVLGCSVQGPRRPHADEEGVSRRGAFEKVVLLTGEIDAQDTVELTVPEVDSWDLKVTWLVVDGAKVETGDRVAALDKTSFARTLAQQRTEVAELRRALTLAEQDRALALLDRDHDVRMAMFALDKAKLQASAAQDLVAARDYQQRQLERRQAEEKLAEARATRARLQKTTALELVTARTKLEKAERGIANARRAIEKLTIRAPRSGIVSRALHPRTGRRLRVGDTIYPSQAVASMPDVRRLLVRARLMETDDRQVAVGMDTRIYFDGAPGRMARGTVTEVSALASDADPDSLRRAFDVTVALQTSGEGWARPGMSARVEVVALRLNDAHLVPRTKIRWRDGQAFAIEGSKDVAHPISIVACSAEACAVNEAPFAVGTRPKTPELK